MGVRNSCFDISCCVRCLLPVVRCFGCLLSGFSCSRRVDWWRRGGSRGDGGCGRRGKAQGKVRAGGGCTHFMHNHSLKAIEPRIPTTPDGARSVSTDQADLACTKREAPRGVRRVAGRDELHAPYLETTCEAEFHTLCVLPCPWDDSFKTGCTCFWYVRCQGRGCGPG